MPACSQALWPDPHSCHLLDPGPFLRAAWAGDACSRGRSPSLPHHQPTLLTATQDTVINSAAWRAIRPRGDAEHSEQQEWGSSGIFQHRSPILPRPPRLLRGRGLTVFKNPHYGFFCKTSSYFHRK